VTLFDPATNGVTASRPTNAVVRWLSNGHSFVLTPDGTRGFVNSAGSDFLAVVDPDAGEVIERVEMGAFP
jgi:DNA-binding beta-propeller fold protein YncE